MKEIRVYKSVWKGLRLMLLCSIFVIPAAYHLLSGGKDGIVICWVCIGFFGLGYPVGLKNILDRRPALRINEHGIMVCSYGRQLINWVAINDCYLTSVNQQLFVCLGINETFALTLSKNKITRVVARFNNAAGFQDVNIHVSPLNVDAKQLLVLLRALIAADIATRTALIKSGL